MKSVFSKMIFGFIITLSLSFIISVALLNYQNKVKVSDVVKNELDSINEHVGTIFFEFGFDVGDKILTEFGKLNNIEVVVTSVHGNSVTYGTVLKHPDSNPERHFDSQGNEIGSHFNNIGDVYYCVGRYECEGEIIYVTTYRTIEFDRTVFIDSILLLTISVSCLGCLFFLIIGKIIVKPIEILSQAQREISNGNYNVRVPTNGEDEFSKLGDGFNVMASSISKHEEIRQRFISDVSHEFQTPLTAIQGFAKILEEEPLDKEQYQKYGSIILHNSKRLTKLSKDMLNLTIYENDSFKLNNTRFSLSQQLSLVVESLRKEAADKNISISIEQQKRDVVIEGDSDRLEQVWLNLLSNAIKYSNENSCIKVIIKRGKKDVTVNIIDYGIGISKEELSNVFDRFYRIDKSRSVEGNGLGLSIVKSIIDLHKGSINVSSVENEGTTVTVEIPVTSV